MAARQQHGFEYEDLIIEKYKDIGMTNINPYTGKELKKTDLWDAFLNKTPVQIKNPAEKGEIGFGDMKRQSQINEPFLIIYGPHREEKSDIIKQYNLWVDNPEEWQTYFNTGMFLKYQQLFDKADHEHQSDAEWKRNIKILRDEYNVEKRYIMQPRPKRDHDKQLRLQCAISHGDFFKKMIPRYEEADFFERYH